MEKFRQDGVRVFRGWVERVTMPTSSPEMSLIDRKILERDGSNVVVGGHVTQSTLANSEKRKMMKTNSSSSASPNSTFELIPEESEAGKSDNSLGPLAIDQWPLAFGLDGRPI